MLSSASGNTSLLGAGLGGWNFSKAVLVAIPEN
jgi:uncharacterized membrane protein YoaK (UPF0700 family)